jgi:hypothetical protein
MSVASVVKGVLSGTASLVAEGGDNFSDRSKNLFSFGYTGAQQDAAQGVQRDWMGNKIDKQVTQETATQVPPSPSTLSNQPSRQDLIAQEYARKRAALYSSGSGNQTLGQKTLLGNA